MRIAIVALLFSLCILPLSVANAATLTVGWNASPSAVAGYKFFYGTSSDNYDYVVDVGNNTSCSISGLEEGTTYYFTVKAYNSERLESEFSEELKYTVTLSNMSVATTDSDNSDSDFIDNSDSGFEKVSGWKSSTGVSSFYGKDYLYAPKGDGTRSASWTYNINTQGQYEIYAQWTSHSNRAPDAPYSIYNNGRLLDVVLVDQRKSGGQFNLLGTYFLNSGTLKIVLTNDASGYVVADATEIVF
jgi:hypothetical protein